MPELPEVETVVRTLEKQLGNVKFKKVTVLWNNIIAYPDVETFEQALVNQQIIKYGRYGKYLIFELSDYHLIVHLRMEGKFYVQDPLDTYDKHVHVIFDLDNQKQLRYHDTRKFGKMYLYAKQVDFHQYECFKHIGLDAFDENLNAEYLMKIANKRKYCLKQFLLDQANIAGIGNIYADEIAFAMQLHPQTSVNRLTLTDFDNLILETRRILGGAIKAGGTTIRSYTSSLGVDGRFQLQLKVHQRAGETCPRCGGVIKKIKVGGRGTYYCEKCQKLQ